MADRVQITSRDRELFELLARARWLSTRQIQGHFFRGRSTNVVSKRMKKLNRGGYIKSVRRGFAEEQFHKLGLRAVALLDDVRVIVPRRLPAQLKHMSDINSIRLKLDEERQLRDFPLRGFWSESELKIVGHAWPVVPDAIAAILVRNTVKYLAVEIDEGTENPGLVVDKLEHYRDSGMAAEGIVAVLVCVSGWPRTRALVRALFGRDWSEGPQCFLTDIDKFRGLSIASQVFVDLATLSADQEPCVVSLNGIIGCPDSLSCREDKQKSVSGCK